MIPFGAGSSLEGHVLPVHGGLSLDLTGMDRVLEINAEDLDCRVQAGVLRLTLEKRLGQDGLFFAVDPGADATLGGMAATAASGTRTTRYGTMRENVLGLQAVLADGTVIQTGSRARKSSAGYDLTRLLLGSEGTLAVITELTLRIHGIPEEIAAARCVFDGLDGAVATVTEAVQLGIPMARCELLDPAAIRAVNAHDELAEPEAYTLFLEFHGGPRSVAEQVESVREIAAGHGGGKLQWTTTTDERNKLWRARHNAYFAVVATRTGTRAQTTDVCVPVSRLAESITASAADAAELPFPAAMVGHVADGNYHWICPVDTDSEAEQAALAGSVSGWSRARRRPAVPARASPASASASAATAQTGWLEDRCGSVGADAGPLGELRRRSATQRSTRRTGVAAVSRIRPRLPDHRQARRDRKRHRSAHPRHVGQRGPQLSIAATTYSVFCNAVRRR